MKILQMTFYEVGKARGLLTLILLFAVSVAWADPIQYDPLQPPPAWLAVSPRDAATAASHEASAPPLGLQVIVLGKSRSFAVIDGRVLAPNDKYNGSTVLAVQLGGVLLRDRSKSLKVAPSVKKKVVSPILVKPQGGTGRGKRTGDGNRGGS